MRNTQRAALRAAIQLCKHTGHTYSASPTGALHICIYCGHSTAPSAATRRLIELAL